MTGAATTLAPIVDWAVAGAALAGEAESGDLHVVAPYPGGVLLALIDGLGHGPEAALASRTAAAVLTEHASETPLSIVQRCHEALRRTRGIVISLASLDAAQSRISWLGIGNVEGALLRGDARAVETIALRGGVVGYQIPPLRPEVLPIRRGDTLVLVTDGVRNDFRAALFSDESPRALADTIFARHAKSTDDACVLVARYTPPTEAKQSVRDESDVAIVRKRIRELGHQEGLSPADVEALATAVTEVAHNILVHARWGEIQITAVTEGRRSGLVVTATDEGPGIPDVARAMEDTYSTTGTLGLGLSSARRLVDEFDLSSTVGHGTTVTMKKWRP